MGVERGCGASEVADSAGRAAFDPEDSVGVVGFEQEFQVVLDVGGAFAEAGGFFDIF